MHLTSNQTIAGSSPAATASHCGNKHVDVIIETRQDGSSILPASTWSFMPNRFSIKKNGDGGDKVSTDRKI